MLSLRASEMRVQSVLRALLFLVTFLIIVLVCLLINWTTDVICANDRARDFIEKIQGIPLEGWRVATLSLSLFFAVVLLTFFRTRWGTQLVPQFLISLIELGLCVGIIAVLGFSYRGALFIANINILKFVPRRRFKFLLLALSLFVYLVADAQMVSISFPLFSINEYMDSYPESLRLWLYGARNLLITGNEILFIVYLGWELQGWIEENTEIRELNAQIVRTSEELAVANVRLEEYARRADESARHRERNRVAGEIHDLLGHTLMGIEVGLKACFEIFHKDPARVQVQLSKIADMARTGVDEVRKVVHEMNAETRRSPTIIESLQLLSSGIRDGVGRSVQLSVEGEPVPVNPIQEEVLYRIAQEGMTNAIAHGDARNIVLELRFNDQSFELVIQDDGKGGGAFQEGFGLRNMRERAESVGGQILFRNREQGFLVMATIPRNLPMRGSS